MELRSSRRLAQQHVVVQVPKRALPLGATLAVHNCEALALPHLDLMQEGTGKQW